jgi:hypothetical protein
MCSFDLAVHGVASRELELKILPEIGYAHLLTSLESSPLISSSTALLVY